MYCTDTHALSLYDHKQRKHNTTCTLALLYYYYITVVFSLLFLAQLPGPPNLYQSFDVQTSSAHATPTNKTIPLYTHSSSLTQVIVLKKKDRERERMGQMAVTTLTLLRPEDVGSTVVPRETSLRSRSLVTTIRVAERTCTLPWVCRGT